MNSTGTIHAVATGSTATDQVALPSGFDESAVIRAILEGTATKTGTEFFDALARHLADALGVDGAWVTEYLEKENRLRAFSFWFRDRYVSDYEYDIRGTPCEAVIRNKCLVHYPENIIALFPEDPDLPAFGAVSYMGAPLVDGDGAVLGHLAVLDTKPLRLIPRVEALFRIFGARAGAELQRLRSEELIRRKEEKLSRLVDSAMDAILELEADFTVTRVNPSAVRTLGAEAERIVGSDFRRFLAGESNAKLERLTRRLQQEGHQSCWIPDGLRALRADGSEFPAEASLSRFSAGGRSYFTVILRSVHDRMEAERRIEYLQQEILDLLDCEQILGNSRPVVELLESIRQVAPTDSTVLICGETGTGKELVARAIHANSRRSGKPLIKVNCAAIPASLMESEFFGHEKGAFTGATQRREGRFALADNGTLFLDEVGELPVDLQAKLLRVLQEGEFEPVGSSRTRTVNVRVIAATNRELREQIRAGTFREDLYYRLHVFPVLVPPLRERGADIDLLAEAFLRKCCRKTGRHSLRLTDEGIRRLHSYSWPGNVRELQNVIERAVITARGDQLNLDQVLPLPAIELQKRPTEPVAEPPDKLLTEREMRDLEKRNLIRALEAAGWRIAGTEGAARSLGMPPSTLSSRMKALGIKRPD